MKWKTCGLLGYVQSGVDPLNNPVHTKEIICHFKARLTQWSAEDVTNLGRNYTKTHRKLLTRLSRLEIVGDRIQWSAVKDYANTSIEVDGAEYDIDTIIDLEPRYRLLHISAYKQ